MKVILKMIGLVILFLGSTLPAQSALIQYAPNPGIVHDTTNDLYWISNLAAYKNYDYSGQLAQISSLNSSPNPTDPWGGWHMAGLSEMNSLWAYSAAEITSVFSPSRIDFGTSKYEGRLNVSGGSGRHLWAQIWDFGGGSYSKSGIGGSSVLDNSVGVFGAWVVAAPNPVPIPATAWLFGSGLIGLIGLARRKV